MGKTHKISLVATISHGCKGKNILCNHESWLWRIFFPLQPWLAVAKRLNSGDFPKNMAFWTPLLRNFYKNGNFIKNSKKLTFLQLSVMVAKGKVSFATMTYGCKAIIIDKFGLLLKIRINQWIWQKRANFISHSSR